MERHKEQEGRNEMKSTNASPGLPLKLALEKCLFPWECELWCHCITTSPRHHLQQSRERGRIRTSIELSVRNDWMDNSIIYCCRFMIFSATSWPNNKPLASMVCPGNRASTSQHNKQAAPATSWASAREEGVRRRRKRRSSSTRRKRRLFLQDYICTYKRAHITIGKSL